MINPPPVADGQHNIRIANLSNDFFQICLELNVPYLDVFTLLKTSENWLQEVEQNDGSHPRASGYSELASLIENWSAWISWFEK